MKNLNPVCWFDIYVTDLDRAKTFYETVLDVKLVDLPPEWGKQSTFPFDESGTNATGALVEKKDRLENGNNTLVYFSSNDCTTEEARIKDAGGQVIQPKTSIGEFGFVSIFLDTEGNTVGLHSRA